MPELDFDGYIREVSNRSGELVTVAVGGPDDSPAGAVHLFGVLGGPRWDGADEVRFFIEHHPVDSVLTFERDQFEGGEATREHASALFGSLLIAVIEPSAEERREWEEAHQTE